MNKNRFFAKVIIFVLIANCIFAGNINYTSADESIDVYFTCEKSIIGQNLIIEPCKISVSKNTRVSEILDKVFSDNNITYVYNGSLTDGFYLSRIKKCDDGTFDIPQIIKNSDVYNRRVNSNNVNAPDLAERSFIGTSGWYYFVNNSAPNVGMSDYKVSDGDVIRIQFTLFGLGEDLKVPANRDKLIKTLANNKDSEHYKEGLKVLKDLDKDKDDIKSIIKKIDPNKDDGQSETVQKESSHDDSQHEGDHDAKKKEHNNYHNNSDNKYQNETNSNGGEESGHKHKRKNKHRNKKTHNEENDKSTQDNKNSANEESNSDSKSSHVNNKDSNNKDSNNNTINKESNNDNLKDNNNKKNNKNESNNSNENDYIIGIASNEAKSITELIDVEHIRKIDEEIEEYKNRIEEIDYKDVALEMQWEMISLLSSGKEIDSEYLNGYKKEFVKSINSYKGTLSNKGTDFSKAVITMSALGISHNEDKYNITNNLKNQDDICSQGLNGPIWALIALSSSDEIKDQYEKERTDYYNILANEWKDKGCFALMGDKGDVDLTAMAVLAGSLYSKDMECDKEFLKEAVKFIEEQSDDNGEFKSMDNINSESLSYATMAMLCVKDKNYDFNRAIDNILSYKTKDGLYAHLYDDKNADTGNAIATQQAMLAFCMISNAYYKNEDKLFNYGDNNNTNVNFLNEDNVVNYEKNETTTEIETKTNNKNKDNGIWVKIVFIGLLVVCLLCACLYYLLRALRKKMESK